MAGDPMGLIDLHQSAGLCAQPETSQDNPQNLSTARTTVLCYVYQTFFLYPHTKEKKWSGYARLALFNVCFDQLVSLLVSL